MWPNVIITILLAVIILLQLFALFGRKLDHSQASAIASSSERVLASIATHSERVERSVREEFGRNREESARSLKEFGDSVERRVAELTQLQESFGA